MAHTRGAHERTRARPSQGAGRRGAGIAPRPPNYRGGNPPGDGPMRKLTPDQKSFVRDMLVDIDGKNRLGIAKWLIAICYQG